MTRAQQSLTFQGSQALKGPDAMSAAQVGTSPFIQLSWTRNSDPDSWQVRRDADIIAGQSVAGLPEGPQKGDDDTWRWTDYTAQANNAHVYRVEAKVGDVVSSGSPTSTVVAYATGLWIADPVAQTQVMLTNPTAPSAALAETSAVYYPLRGTDAVRVTQNQRGYEGDQSGQIVGSDAPGMGSRAQYLAFTRMRQSPDRPMVIAYPFIAFTATLSAMNATPARSLYQKWDVSFHFEQQGTSLWLAQEFAVDDSARLLGTYEYEEGTSGTAVTTSSPDVVGVSGAPTYQKSAAVHGDMGWNCPAVAGGGNLLYNISYIGMADFYFTPRASGGDSICQLLPAAAGQVAYLNLATAGSFKIADDLDHIVATTTVATWVVGQTMRTLVAWEWANNTITVKQTIWTAAESLYAAETYSATFPALSAPGKLLLGNGTASMDVDFDSLRLYAGTAGVPPPLNPGETVQVLWSIPGAGA